MSERQLKTPPAKIKSNKRHYIKRLSEGRCVSCGTMDDRTLSGKPRCEACNAKAHPKTRKKLTEEQRAESNAYRREWAQMRKSAHVCVQCGRVDARTLAGRSFCLQHGKRRSDLAKQNYDPEHQKELREARKDRWIAAGLCSNCGHPKEEPDKKLCINCRVRAKMRKERKKAEDGVLPRGFGGKCYQCNSAPAIEGKKLCRTCYDRRVAILRDMASKRKNRA